jgi:cation transport protein ChaC
MPAATHGIWVFAYGSLMWRPGFPHEEVRDAWLLGYHRSLCVYSWVHRGTETRPGLVLGLDRGGSCRGRVYRIAPAREDEVLRYLDERELVTAVYERRRLRVRTPNGHLPAWCYVVRRAHAQYAGRLDEERTIALIRQGQGVSGHCRDYLVSTVDHLDAMGVVDGPLHRLVRRLTQDVAGPV